MIWVISSRPFPLPRLLPPFHNPESTECHNKSAKNHEHPIARLVQLLQPIERKQTSRDQTQPSSGLVHTPQSLVLSPVKLSLNQTEPRFSIDYLRKTQSKKTFRFRRSHRSRPHMAEHAVHAASAEKPIDIGSPKRLSSRNEPRGETTPKVMKSSPFFCRAPVAQLDRATDF